MDLPIEIWQQCLSHSEFLIQIRLRCVCKLFHEKLEVYKFSDSKLTDDILRNYSFIRELNAYNNPRITTVNHMSRLEILYAGWNCCIDDIGIQNANLKELYAYNNPKITRAKKN